MVVKAYLESMCVVPDKAVAICDTLNVKMTNGLVSQVWPAKKTSSIIFNQSHSGGPELTQTG
jgi:hypothetical protein